MVWQQRSKYTMIKKNLVLQLSWFNYKRMNKQRTKVVKIKISAPLFLATACFIFILLPVSLRTTRSPWASMTRTLVLTGILVRGLSSSLSRLLVTWLRPGPWLWTRLYWTWRASTSFWRAGPKTEVLVLYNSLNTT